jgi:trimeric autotransporter adhesin
MTNPFPNGLLAPLGNSQGPLVGVGTSLNNLVNPNTKAPRVHQYSADVQRGLGGGIALEVGFVGSHSDHLTLGEPQVNIDALNPTYLSMGAAALNAPVANPFLSSSYIRSVGGTLAGSTIPAFRLLLPYAAYTAVNENFGDSTATGPPGSGNYANYNSLVIRAAKRFSDGLVFLSNFTWSKNMDENSGGVGNSLNSSPGGYPQNPYTFAGEYSYSNVDAPLRWATSVSYQLPFGRGKHFLKSIGRAADLVVGGWVVNTVSVYQSGFPLQIYQNDSNSEYGYGIQRPNMTGTSPVTNGSLEQRLYNWINPAAFSVAPPATFGNTPRTLGSLRGPTLANWDASIFKNFQLKERLKPSSGLKRSTRLTHPISTRQTRTYRVASSDKSPVKRTSRGNFSLRFGCHSKNWCTRLPKLANWVAPRAARELRHRIPDINMPLPQAVFSLSDDDIFTSYSRRLRRRLC